MSDDFDPSLAALPDSTRRDILEIARAAERIRADAPPEVVATMPGAKALVAAVIEEAAEVTVWFGKVGPWQVPIQWRNAIRNLTPADATAALARMLQEARQEGWNAAREQAAGVANAWKHAGHDFDVEEEIRAMEGELG